MPLRNLIFVFSLGVLTGCSSSSQPDFSAEKIREFANELYNRQLFEQAVDQYRFYLENYNLEPKEQANITYQIANIYFDRMRDYKNSLAHFLKIKTLYPESPLISKVNKKVIACLERLQRPADAQQALKESTSFAGQTQKSRPGEVIAKIGNRDITLGDLDFEISKLPPELRSQYIRIDNKIEFLRRYLATELLYDSAKRQGLDNDSQVLENVFQAKKTFMVTKLLDEEISKKVKITEDDVKLYYDAHKDDFAEKDEDGNVKRMLSFEEAGQQAAQKLAFERQEKAYNELISSLFQAEKVVIYDDLIK